MSVPESQRGEGKFQVLIEANNLALHTIQICKNEKYFDPKYTEAMTSDIIETAKNIFINAFSANEIKVQYSTEAEKRLNAQESAIDACGRLLALMQMAKKLFHLPSKKVKYWGEMTIRTRELLKNWHNSDCKRYRSIE